MISTRHNRSIGMFAFMPSSA